MLKVEEYLINSERQLVADENYISDGIIIVAKDKIENPLLKQYKNIDENIMSTIPFEKGEQYDLPAFCELFPRKILGFVFDEKYSFDYDFFDVFASSFYGLDYYTVRESGNRVPILKAFDEDDEFVGCFLAFKRVNNENS
ncbi:MAG: hypothetical protein PHV37_09175 [Candidatus Gastranaerophilales bacterium]|nr:hypothetical protein [Candidatus Gastranaerophilales bacterium]